MNAAPAHAILVPIAVGPVLDDEETNVLQAADRRTVGTGAEEEKLLLLLGSERVHNLPKVPVTSQESKIQHQPCMRTARWRVLDELIVLGIAVVVCRDALQVLKVKHRVSTDQALELLDTEPLIQRTVAHGAEAGHEGRHLPLDEALEQPSRVQVDVLCRDAFGRECGERVLEWLLLLLHVPR